MKCVVIHKDRDVQDDKTHIIGGGIRCNATLCGWVDVKHTVTETEEITCKVCLDVVKYVKGLKKGRDF